MQLVMSSDAPGRREKLRGSLLFGAAYPFFLAAEGLQRGFEHFFPGEDAPAGGGKSAFAAAGESAAIALSYASMARTAFKASPGPAGRNANRD